MKLNPDIILLLIGTNNAMDNYNFNITIIDFISLINYFLENINKNSIIFVATIPDIDPNIKSFINGLKITEKKIGMIMMLKIM